MKLTPLALTLTFAVCGFSPALPRTTISPNPHRSNLPAADQDVTEETKGKLRHEFGFSFLVYRDKIQTELALSPDQKGALDNYLQKIAPAYMSFLQSKDAHQDEFEAYRSKARENLEAKLKETLSDAQRKRLGELVRQREGLFGGPSLWTGLEITDEEKAQFMALIEPMHKKMEAVAAETQHAGNPAVVQRQVLALRADLERQMEAVLTESQRKQWKEMLGKPIAIESLFDLTAG